MGALAARLVEPVESVIEEVAADLDEVAWLAEGARTRLAEARRAADSMRSAYRERTLVTYRAQARSAEAALASYEEEIRECILDRRSRAAAHLSRLETARAAYADLVRMQVSVAAALIVGADWQSPPFGCAGAPAAGRFEGRVVEHHDDYKRDRHPDAAVLEAAYAAEFAGAPGVRGLLTSCGMSAFTTILGYLEHERLVSGRVVIGRGLYHECRSLLRSSSLAGSLVEIDEDDADALIGALEEGGALFLDAMCNASSLAVCDLRRVLAGAARRNVTVVIDTTCTSVSCRPYALLPPGARCRLLVFESLTKYGQFGLDRTAAGLILARPGDSHPLDEYREHLGTNISDVAACTLPVPDRRRLLRRLRRIARNAQVLARGIQAASASCRSAVTGVVYPGLPGHPSHAAAGSLGFPGGLLSLRFRPGADRPETHERVVEAMLSEAARNELPLSAGASFGFDVTRIYRTAVASDLGPFVRIAPGIESLVAVERLAAALADACAGA